MLSGSLIIIPILSEVLLNESEWQNLAQTKKDRKYSNHSITHF